MFRCEEYSLTIHPSYKICAVALALTCSNVIKEYKKVNILDKVVYIMVFDNVMHFTICGDL